jgi:hypothetical protein
LAKAARRLGITSPLEFTLYLVIPVIAFLTILILASLR